MKGNSKLLLVSSLSGAAAGVVVTLIALPLLFARGSITFRQIKIENEANKTSVMIGTDRLGQGKIAFVDDAQRETLVLGLQRASNRAGSKLIPYESFQNPGGPSAILLTVDSDGNGVINMGDGQISGRLLLGRIHWEDSRMNDSTVRLWGLQLNGNPGGQRKSTGLGLALTPTSERAVDLSEPPLK